MGAGKVTAGSSQCQDHSSIWLGRAIAHSSEGKDRDGEESTDRIAETGAVGSPGVIAPIHDSSERGELENSVRSLAVPLVGTPSTVSTAPSTADASLGTDYKLDDPSLLPHLLQPSLYDF